MLLYHLFYVWIYLMSEQAFTEPGLFEGIAAQPSAAAIGGQAAGLAPALAEQTDVLNTVARLYQELQAAERREPLPGDQIRTGQIKPEAPEYGILRANGVSEQQLAGGILTREQLLGAGYFFLNRLGGHSKALLSGEIPDPASQNGTLNFGHRALLTRAELQTVYDYQQAHQEIFGLNGEQLDAVRSDMLAFLLQSTSRPPFGSAYDYAQQALPYRPSSVDIWEHELSEAEWKLLDKYWSAQAREYRRAHPQSGERRALAEVREAFVREHCADMRVWQEDGDFFNTKQVRGNVVQSITSRSRKLMWGASPFLESGFVFGYNFDVSVYYGAIVDIRSDKQYRVNTAVLHLMGGHSDFPGLSEMGGAREQVYMPAGIFVRDYYARDKEVRAEVLRDVERNLAVDEGELKAEAQRRALKVARSWEEVRPRRIARILEYLQGLWA
jgi:hypothetical protein